MQKKKKNSSGPGVGVGRRFHCFLSLKTFSVLYYCLSGSLISLLICTFISVLIALFGEEFYFAPYCITIRNTFWERGSGWGTHVNPWLIHVNVWQKPLQYCKVISLQRIKINGKKKKKYLLLFHPPSIYSHHSSSIFCAV